MKKLVLIALLAVVFWGCGGDETTTVLAHEKTGFEVAANMDGLGKCDSAHVADIAYVKDSAKVFFCNGSVWRSVDGRNGKDGTNGKDGKDGKDGKTGVDGEVGSICSVTSSGEVYTLVCGRDSVKVNTHLKTPSSCETVKNEDGTVTLKCGGKSATTIRGEDGEDAPVCKYVDNEDGTMLQVCGDVSVVLYGDFCGEEPYDPDTAFCYGVTLYPKCGGYVYDVATQACSDTGSVLEYCGDILYDPTIYNCHDDLTRSSLCGGQQYNAFYSFCYEGKVYPVCGYVGNEYDPTKYHCEADRIVGSVTDSAGNVYRTVKLGQYEWMAENYRLNVEGSLCPSEVAEDEAYSGIKNLDKAKDVDCSKVGRVYTVSIIPTGMGAGGYTMQLPEKDEMYMTRGRMLQEIMVSLGGRIAEELVLDDITTGASADIRQATNIARHMVMRYGMSEKIGTINYEQETDDVFLGYDLGHENKHSEYINGEIDKEVRRIITDCYAKAREIIVAHQDILYKAADLLIEKEKITGEEFDALFSGKAAPANA